MMAETEQVVVINGHTWVKVPRDSTQGGPLYSERQVRAAGGDPAALRGAVVTNKEE